uniref:Uncharacterized protein n=1 Tax=Rhizophora mucronata TaxID=61149 RepID=A0A2P2MZM0_RHIMU
MINWFTINLMWPILVASHLWPILSDPTLENLTS